MLGRIYFARWYPKPASGSYPLKVKESPKKSNRLSWWHRWSSISRRIASTDDNPRLRHAYRLFDLKQADTGGRQMATWRPDPTFYPSPRLATQAPPEKLAYVATIDPTRKHPDVMAVVDLDSESTGYGRIVGQTDLAVGDA